MEDLDDDDVRDFGPHVNLVFIGPCGCGKSTAAGRLIAECGAIDAQSLDRIACDAQERGQEIRRYAWILDKLQSERERGGTIYAGLWQLRTERCRFTIIDAPGHNDFVMDAVTAISSADIAVLVVSAVESDLDGQRVRDGLLREHTLLAYTLGVRRVVVCVNKMDSELVSYSEEHFSRTCAVVREDLANVGYIVGDVPFVPTSAWAGANIKERGQQTPWYSGPTLLDALHGVVASDRQPERSLRIPVREVMQIGGTGVVVVGRIETGLLKPGEQLVFEPGGVRAKVLSIEMHHEQLSEAHVGDSPSLKVDVPMKTLKRGMVASCLGDSCARECASFLAKVIVLGPSRTGEIRRKSVLTVECHTAQVLCVFEELLSRADRHTGKELEKYPEALHEGDAAVVRLRPQDPLCVEPFEKYPPLGRFTMRDQKSTVVVGVVLEAAHEERGAMPGLAPFPVSAFSAGAAAQLEPPALRALGLGPPRAKTRAGHAAKPRPTSQAGGSAGHSKVGADPSGSAFGSSPFAAFGAVQKQKATKEAPRSTQSQSSPKRARPPAGSVEGAGEADADTPPPGTSPKRVGDGMGTSSSPDTE